VIRGILTMNRSMLGWANAIAQRAALEALTNGPEDRKWREWMLGQYRSQRKVMADGLTAIPGVHVYDLQAAFYAWVRYDALLSSIDLMKYLYERGLAVRPGSEFGRCGEGHIRLSFSPAPEIIAAGVKILRAALEELAAQS
jgi:aspartate aminotransferase